MATVSNNTWRFTYTLTTEQTYVVATFTKLEYYSNYSGKTRHNPGESQIFYYDQSGSNVQTSIATPQVEYSGIGWKTIWTGTKVVTSYRQTIITSIGTIAGTIDVPALPSNQVTYNTDGGSAAPDAQLKYLGKPLTLTTTIPTKTGHTFVNWRSSADNKLYSRGAVYDLDEATTMTAQWNVNTYIVSYKLNGGSGVIYPQQKTYNVSSFFSDGATIYKKETVDQITREYELLHWNTNPDDSGNSYAKGAEIPNIINNLDVYAIWGAKYFYPFISNLKTYRTSTSSITDKTAADKGKYIHISFEFIGCSDDGGETYKIPNCVIRIDDDFYTPTLTFDTSPNGSVEFKADVEYSLDNPHNITIEITDPDHSSSKFIAYDYITSGIYPIDLYDNELRSEVYMGIMHPYVNGIPLTLTDSFIDGDVDIKLDVDPNASSVTPAVSGEDKDLFNNIINNGWHDYVLSDNKLKVKKWADKMMSSGTSASNVFVDFVVSGSTAPAALENTVLRICNEYPNAQNTIFTGRYVFRVESTGAEYTAWYQFLIENTSDVDAANGLPKRLAGLSFIWSNSCFHLWTTTVNNEIVIRMSRMGASYDVGNYNKFTYNTGFTYNNNSPLAHLRNGVVTLYGAFQTTQEMASNVLMGSVPSGFEPYSTVRFVCPVGDTKNTYILHITETGQMRILEYGLTSTTRIPNGSVLYISCTYTAKSY